MINNATFFAGYNHLHHFHKANVLYHFYHNDVEYFERVLKPQYTALQLSTFFFPGEESYFKRTMVLEMRNTYLHAVETMFTLFEVLRVHHQRLHAKPDSVDILYHMLTHNQKNLYHNIRKYGHDIQSLNHMDTVLAEELTLGRFLFYPAMNPPDAERRQAYLKEVTVSLNAIKKGLHLMAKDFIQHEYNSYKHGMRVLDGFEFMAFQEPGSDKITKVQLPESFTFPRIVKEKNAPDRYDIQVRPADFERDYRMSLLTARFIHLLTNNRRIAHNMDTMPFPDVVPLPMFEDKDIDWHAKDHVKGSADKMSRDEFMAWYAANRKDKAQAG